ncbi:hypothetical protein [Nocardioides alcanivorans]|uniref:hypothetical protein n=1 Tax=Nocardioides alcanivorans TaxID=2897352 RepID=UPI001F1998CA|nr:hypothetical protein [Nocardioides alcanivorans]
MKGLLRLVRVELRRLLHRRAVVLLLAACVAIPLVIGIAEAIDTRPASDDEVAAARAELERELENGRYERDVRDCVEAPGSWGLPANLPAEEAESACRDVIEPTLDWYLWSPQLDLASVRDEGSGLAVAMVLTMLLMLVGTTFTGHDWASGSVSNQVLFEPRRGRVWAGKAIVVTGTAFVVSLVVLGGFWLALDTLASSRGLPHGGGLLRDCLAMALRASFIAALAALLGYALTMLFRSTVATLGIVFGVALVGGMLLAVLGFDGNLNPAHNVLAVILHGFHYSAEVPCPPGDMSGWCYEDRQIGLGQGLAYVGTVVAALCAVSLTVFRRRDIP